MAALGFSLLLLAFAAYLAFGRFEASAASILFCAAWGVMLLLYRLLGYNYEYLLWVIGFTAACIVAWVAGELGTAALYRREHVSERLAPKRFEFAFLPEFLLVTTAIGMIAPLDWAATTGLDLARIKDVGALLDAAQSAHILLSQQRVEQSPVNKICLMVALSGVIMAGIFIGTGRAGRRVPTWMLFAPTLPYLSMMLLTTIRSMMIVPVIMMFVSWVAGLALNNRDRSIFKGERLVRIGVGVIVIFAIIAYLQGVRAGDYTFSRVDETMSRLRLWFAGYEPALVAYMSRIWDGQLQWGSSSFRVFASLFGADDTALAYGAGQLDIGMNEKSNAMTALRFILEDWGLAGAVVFCAIWGAVTGLVGEITRTGKLWIAPLLALLIAVALFSPNSWFLNYGTRCFAPVLTIGYLMFFGKVLVNDAIASTAQGSEQSGRGVSRQRAEARRKLGL
jgi:oligosaccharide repeat unit polymerase